MLYLLDPIPLSRPELWAEDGELFAQAWELGIRSLNDGVGGTLHSLGRVVAWGTRLFPVHYAPHVLAYVSSALFAVVHGAFAHSAFEPLLPGRAFRIAFALIFTAGAGTSEVAYNVANYPTLLTWAAFLLLVAADGRLSLLRTLMLTTVFFSSPSTIVLFPCVAVLCAREWRRPGEIIERRTRRVAVALVAATFVAAHGANAILTNRFAREPYHLANQPLLAEGNAAAAPFIYLDQLFSRVFVLPFLGDSLSRKVLQAPSLLFWPAMLLLLGAALAVLRRAKVRPGPQQLQLLAAVLAAPLTYALIAVARNYHAGMLTSLLREGAEPYWNGRYAFLMARLSPLLFLSGVALILPNAQARQAATAVLLTGFLAVNAVSFRRNLRSDMNWPATARAIEAREPGCRLPLQPLMPHPWKVIDCPTP